MKNKILSLFALCACSFLLSGCLSSALTPKVDHTKIFILNPEANPVALEGLSGVKMKVDFVQAPVYMQDYKIVASIEGKSELDVSESNRWIEPPTDSFARVITANIIKLTGSSDIYSYLFVTSRASNADAVLNVCVTDCIGQLNGKLKFRALWEIDSAQKNKSEKPSYKTGIFTTEVAIGATYDSYVKAMEKALFELSQDIVKNLQEQPKK